MRDQRAMRLIAVLSLAIAACGAARAGEPGRLVLDETAYWRYYVEFAPDRLDTATLKAEGGKLPGRDLKAVEKGVKRYFAPPFAQPGQARDWTRADWRDEPLFFVSQRCNCGTDDERSWRQIHTPPPRYATINTVSPTPWAASSRRTHSSMGRPLTVTMGFGMVSVSGCRRLPLPPHNT